MRILLGMSGQRRCARKNHHPNFWVPWVPSKIFPTKAQPRSQRFQEKTCCTCQQEAWMRNACRSHLWHHAPQFFSWHHDAACFTRAIEINVGRKPLLMQFREGMYRMCQKVWKPFTPFSVSFGAVFRAVVRHLPAFMIDKKVTQEAIL